MPEITIDANGRVWTKIVDLDFTYKPEYGPLSGRSFESQTEAFLGLIYTTLTALIAELQKAVAENDGAINDVEEELNEAIDRIDALENWRDQTNNRLDGIEANIEDIYRALARHEQHLQVVDGRLDDLEFRVASLEQRMADAENRITSLEEGMEKLRDDFEAFKASSPPPGAIMLYPKVAPPQGYAVCDGSGGTVDLSGFVTSPLTYIQRNQGS